METSDDLPMLIGRRIAERRAALRLSLDEVAGRTGVSRAMVSRIERGEVHASAVVLDRLAGGLGLTLSALFARETASPLLRRHEQPTWTDPDTLYVRREVAPTGTGSPVRIVEIEFPAGAEIRFEHSPGRTIDQHVWVLEGEIEAELDQRRHVLGEGDCLHMRLTASNAFRNTSGRPARYAVILNVEPGP